jgi:hypothetical protein
MPTVPRLNPQAVQQRAIQGARVSADTSVETFGGGQALTQRQQALTGIAETVTRIEQEERQKANDIATTDYYTKLAQKKQELFWDTNKGVIARKGKDSFSALDDYGKEFDAYADELEQGLASPEQREMAQKIRARERLEFDESIHRHMAKESSEFQDQTVKAGIKTARDEAVLNYMDPEKVKRSIQLQESLIMQGASGKPPALVQAEVQEVRSQTHASVIERRLTNGDDTGAMKYFEAVKGEITDPTSLKHLETALNEGKLRGQSQRTSLSIVRGSADLGEALEKTLAIKDPKLQDEVRSRVKDYFQTKKAAEKERQDELFQAAANFTEQTKERPDPVTWSALDLSQRNAIDARIKQLKEGVQPETKWDSYYELKTLASSPATRSQFLQTNLLQYRTQFADTEFKELVNLQTSLRKGDEKVEKILDGFRSDSAIVNDALKEIGVNPSPKPGSDDAMKVSLFRRKVDEQVQLLQQRTGKKITNDEMQNIVDNLTIKGVTEKGWIWDTKKRAFELERGEEFEVDPRTIPGAERKKIEAAIRSLGGTVTDTKVAELYKKKLQRTANGAN